MRTPMSIYVFAMTTTARRLAVPGLLFQLVSLACGQSALAQGGLASFERDALIVETSKGARHDLNIELALSRNQQAQGLMYRRDLGQDAGMLFVYRPARMVSMWMKNTLIPLDMLFIAGDGRILKIVERTVPLSLKMISSDRPVRAVLEVNGGTAARLGLSPGDRVLYRVFDQGS